MVTSGMASAVESMIVEEKQEPEKPVDREKVVIYNLVSLSILLFLFVYVKNVRHANIHYQSI